MINFSSPKDISLLFFGGVIKQECQTEVLNELGVQERYKTGKKRGELKTKKGIKLIEVKGLGLKPLEEWKTKKPGIYSTDEDVLKTIARGDFKLISDQGKLELVNPEIIKIDGNLLIEGHEKGFIKVPEGGINVLLQEWTGRKLYSESNSVRKLKREVAKKIALYLLELRGLEKELGTYYAGQKKGKKTGFEHLIYPDSCIRGSINHCSTDTGRTASNKPNLQNVPSS